MKNNWTIFLLILGLSFAVMGAKTNPIELNGSDGGYINGKIWKSDFLLGNTKVLIYADPDNFSDIKDFVKKLKEEKSKNNNFDLTFVINTEATMIPTFMIKSKIKKKAKKSPTISYVLDNNKILVDKWQLEDNAINVLILDSLNQIQYHNIGEMTETQFKKVMAIITKIEVEK